MVDGGFLINCVFIFVYLYELVKMDGVFILNDSGSKILFVNV